MAQTNGEGEWRGRKAGANGEGEKRGRMAGAKSGGDPPACRPPVRNAKGDGRARPPDVAKP